MAAARLGAGCEVRAGEGDFSFDMWHGQAQDTWERTYTVAPGGRLEILNVNGEIRGRGVDRRAGRTCAPSARVKAGSDEAAKDLLRQDRDARGGRPRAGARRDPRAARPLGRAVTRSPTPCRCRPASTSTCAPSTAACGSTTSAGKCGRRRPTAACAGALADVSMLDARTTNGGVELEMAGALARRRPRHADAASTAASGWRCRRARGRRHARGAPTAGSASTTCRFAVEGEQTRRRPGRPPERRRRPHRPADHQRRRLDSAGPRRPARLGRAALALSAGRRLCRTLGGPRVTSGP